jgi:hypothetical protein
MHPALRYSPTMMLTWAVMARVSKLKSLVLLLGCAWRFASCACVFVVEQANQLSEPQQAECHLKHFSQDHES